MNFIKPGLGFSIFRFQFVRYLISGSLSALVDVLLLIFLSEVLNIWYLYSSIMSFVAAFVTGFLLQKFWTFKYLENKTIVRQVTNSFLFSAFVFFLANILLMYVLVDKFGVWYVYAKILIGASFAVLSYFFYKYVVFVKKEESPKNPTLLFITQKISPQDDDLAFTILWIREFQRQGLNVRTICLESRNPPKDLEIYSLGKENGVGFLGRVKIFYKLIFSLDYDRVFVHMNPEYITLAGWYWWITGRPMYLWYTHYKMHVHLWLSGLLCKRMFAATPQSLPQYNNSPKKVVTGHGIDVSYWDDNISAVKENSNAVTNLLTVHRICRSKRLEIGIESLKYLSDDYHLTIYGRDVEKDYYSEIKELINKQTLGGRVEFMGPVPMQDLKNIYPNYRIMINMASETIDKTMLEGMLYGVYPITTAANSLAIGLPVYPENDDPKTIASFIIEGKWKQFSRIFLRYIVMKNHSLSSLIVKMNKYIIPGK